MADGSPSPNGEVRMALTGQPMEIVGTPTLGTLGELPLLLTPIYRATSGTDSFYLGHDTADSGAYSPADTMWIEAEFAAGTMRRFDAPIRVLPDHVLLQLTPGDGPAYLPSTEVAGILKRAGETAIKEAAEFARRGRRLLAARRAAYATRALPKEPLPLLLTWALGLRVFAPTAMRFLARDLQAIPRAELLDAVGLLKDELSPLRRVVALEWKHLRVDPLPESCRISLSLRPFFLDGLGARGTHPARGLAPEAGPRGDQPPARPPSETSVAKPVLSRWPHIAPQLQAA